MMGALGGLVFPISARNQSGPALRGVLGDLGRVRGALAGVNDYARRAGQTMRAIGLGLSLAVTTPLMGLGALTLNTSADFESSMNQVAAVSRAVGSEFSELRAQAREMGATTQFSASQAADAMGFLAMAGFDANSVIEALPGTLQLAAAAQMELGAAADTVSNILSGYSLEIDELGRVNDVLVATFTSSNTNLQQLGEAMTYAGPVANAAGIQFEETAAAIGLMGNAGIQASMAGTSLRGALSRLLNPSDSAAAVMRSLGLEFTNADGRVRSLAEILDELAPHADDAGLFMELFGQRAGPAFAALVSQGSAALRRLTTNLEESGGIAAEIASVQMEGLRGALMGLRSAFEGLLISIGDSGLLETATNLVDRLTELTRAASETNPELLRLGTTFGALAAAAGPVLAALGLMTIGISAIATPLGLVIAGMAAGTAALIGLAVAIQDNETVLRALAVVMAGLIATQIPALAMGLASLVAGMSAATIGANVLAVSMTALRGALMLLGGPWGLLAGLVAAAATYFLVFRDNAGEAETAAYDAADGTAALNSALGIFHTTAAPSAGQAAINLANDNYRLAESALYAAEAELARRRAILESSRVTYDTSSDPEAALLLGEEMAAAQRAYNEQLEILASAENAVAEASRGRDRAARAVTGATYGLTDALGAQNEELDVAVELAGGLGGALGEAAESSKSLADGLGDLGGATDEVAPIVQRLSDMFGSTFSGIIRGSVSAGDALDRLVDRLADMLISSAFNDLLTPLFGMFGGKRLSGLFGGGFADGAAFTRGQVVPFADGGIVGSPTFFGMSHGRTGLMGEAGPEAILPLARGAGGKLGVQATGAGRSEVVVRLAVPQGVTIEEARQISGDISVQVVEEYDRGLPDRVQGINRDPEARF